jgi:acetylornithine deacetylase/succinyl-diaminopimelate desuccinylase-like protein
VRGLDDAWSGGLRPWAVTERDGRWYGRGTADNKGQHAINLAALEAVLAERGGRLGFNVKFVLEMAEERGSTGLREFVAAHAEELVADALIASDGPRVEPGLPTIATGTRGTFHFDLAVRLRAGGVHSGHWGGLTPDPAIILAHAIGRIADRHGRVLVRDWMPGEAVPPDVRAVLAGCPVGAGEDAPAIPADWGEPGLTSAEKIYGWASFIVLAMTSGTAGEPGQRRRARCHRALPDPLHRGLRSPALRGGAARAPRRARLPGGADRGKAGVRMAASRTAPDHPWVRWTRESMERSLGTRVQVIPNSSGGLPGDVFVDHLGVPLVWIPHSYGGCKQHGPDEHVLPELVRSGLTAFAGIWWDLGEGRTPGR